MFIHIPGKLQSSRNIDIIVSATDSKTEGQSRHLFRDMVTDVLFRIVVHMSGLSLVIMCC